MLLNRS